MTKRRAPCQLHLTNGWTVSISPDDTPPALCSVAAWPSRLDDDPNVFKTPGVAFDFDGRSDQRCFSLEDVRVALAKVEAAEEPPCGCGTGWVKDENWSPPSYDPPRERIPGDGMIQCGHCHGTARWSGRF